MLMKRRRKGRGLACVSMQPPERRAGRRRSAAAAASSPLADTDLLLVSRPRHGPRSPACSLRITAGPVRAAVHLVDDTSSDDEGEDDDEQLELQSESEACAERERRAPMQQKIAIVWMRSSLRAKSRTLVKVLD